ncbi:hypothetical protein GW17_00055350 [Ensete ventricosum]|nr:hypothetical protein GW17_00055350 [Ensete ventricosum]
MSPRVGRSTSGELGLRSVPARMLGSGWCVPDVTPLMAKLALEVCEQKIEIRYTRRYSSASTIALVDSRDLIRWNCRLAVRSYTRLAALRQAPSRIAKVVADVAELTSRADVILRLTWLGRLDGPNIYPIILSPLPEEVLHEVSRGGVLDDFTTRGSVAPWLGLLHLLWEFV